MDKKVKFLVLKNKILEKENNIKHQFFRRRRFTFILKCVLDYLTLVDVLPFLMLNKN